MADRLKKNNLDEVIAQIRKTARCYALQNLLLEAIRDISPKYLGQCPGKRFTEALKKHPATQGFTVGITIRYGMEYAYIQEPSFETVEVRISRYPRPNDYQPVEHPLLDPHGKTEAEHAAKTLTEEWNYALETLMAISDRADAYGIGGLFSVTSHIEYTTKRSAIPLPTDKASELIKEAHALIGEALIDNALRGEHAEDHEETAKALQTKLFNYLTKEGK